MGNMPSPQPGRLRNQMPTLRLPCCSGMNRRLFLLVSRLRRAIAWLDGLGMARWMRCPAPLLQCRVVSAGQGAGQGIVPNASKLLTTCRSKHWHQRLASKEASAVPQDATQLC